jgi:YD repeat-containing protein
MLGFTSMADEFVIAGNLTQVTDRKGQVTTFTYDALNRRTQVIYDATSTTSYSYDAEIG